MKIMNEKQFAAEAENLAGVMAYIREFLENSGCSSHKMQQILLATEEIFVNIVHYAYGDEKGMVTVKCARLDSPDRYALWFSDTGEPFDPTVQKAPDISENLLDREVGGLGIFLVGRLMDKMTYSRENGQNILYVEKE